MKNPGNASKVPQVLLCSPGIKYSTEFSMLKLQPGGRQEVGGEGCVALSSRKIKLLCSIDPCGEH